MHHLNMACDGSSEKDIIVDQTSIQTKNISENPPPLQSQYCLQYIRLEKDVKQIRKKSIKPVAQVLMKATLRSM